MTNSKNILITGASGYLGQHLISSLCTSTDSNYKITAAYGHLETFVEDVNGSSLLLSSASSVTLVKDLDLTSKDAVASVAEAHGPFDTVVHLAAISSPGVCEKEPDRARAVNCPSALLDALPPTTDVIFLSTDQVYDGQNAPYVETDEAKSPVNLYGQTKLDFERLLMEKFPTNGVALRSSLIIGPKTPFQCRKQTFLQFVHDRLQKQEDTSFFTDEFRSVVYVADICLVIRHFIDNGVGSKADIYCMGGAERVSRLDFAEAVAKHCGLDTACAKGVARSSLPNPGPVASPPDISMDTSKLEKAVGIKMRGLAEMLEYCVTK